MNRTSGRPMCSRAISYLLTGTLLCVMQVFHPPPVRANSCYSCLINGVDYYSSADSVTWAPTTAAGYDMRIGRFFEENVGDVVVRDTYRIESIASNDSIPIHVDLQVDMIVGSGGTGPQPCFGRYNCTEFDLYIFDASYNIVSTSFHSGAGAEFTGSLGFDLNVVPGEDFTLGFRVSVPPALTTSGSYAAYANIRFTGVPPGARLTSCLGLNDSAVPTLPTSWGALKAKYR